MTDADELSSDPCPEEDAIELILNLLDAAIKRIAYSLDAEVAPDAADVNELREFVYRLLSTEFALPNKTKKGGLRRLFRGFGYEDREIDDWLRYSPSSAGGRRSERLEYYADWLTFVLARPEPTDLSDLHAGRARASSDGRLEQVRESAAARCIKEHWLGSFPLAVRNGVFKSTATCFVFRATIGGKLYRADGSRDQQNLALLTRTILFPILETPGGLPLYWRTANDPQYRNVCEDNPLEQIPVERKKGTVIKRDMDPSDDMSLHRLLRDQDTMVAMLNASSLRLFLVCRTCGHFVRAGSDGKKSRCVTAGCTWDPIVVRESELADYELADDHVHVKVCRSAAHIWPASGSSRCPAAGCGSPPMAYNKKKSTDLPVTFPENVDYEGFLRDFDV
jgi:hypothetical protein